MKVRCIDNIRKSVNGEWTYTVHVEVGSIYTVIYEDERYYKLKERGGYFEKSRFIKVE